MLSALALVLAVIAADNPGRFETPPQHAANPSKSVTNADVTSMTKAGLSEGVIVAAVQNGTPEFDLSPAGLIALKNAGVSDRVLEAMQARSAARPGGAAPSSAAPCRIFITEEEPPSGAYVLVRKEIQVGKKFYGSQDDNLMRELARQADKAGADAIIKYHEWRAPSAWSWAAAKAGGMAVRWTPQGSVAVASLKGQCWSPKAADSK